MPQPNELRVFISSTFQDLLDEREHLVKKIFPEYRAHCHERSITVTESGLRWEEADPSSDRVIRTSLEAIDRTRPYFIGITGESYGFVPQTSEIGADPELIERFPWIEEAIKQGASLTDLEFRHGALNELVNEANTSRAIFYFRQRHNDRHAPSIDYMKLAGLERRVRQRGFRIREYRDAHSLGELIRADLLEILDRDFTDAQPEFEESSRPGLNR